ncbi:MAG: hypothetical protein HYR96_14035 [Deltaproteobacteria bacterium]|nr:hypothetical protein [Deltaproteobacteria bacterium]MBI3295563.1 hypothetical protein [Deltaproteobacteria bacterium]
MKVTFAILAVLLSANNLWASHDGLKVEAKGAVDREAAPERPVKDPLQSLIYSVFYNKGVTGPMNQEKDRKFADLLFDTSAELAEIVRKGGEDQADVLAQLMMPWMGSIDALEAAIQDDAQKYQVPKALADRLAHAAHTLRHITNGYELEQLPGGAGEDEGTFKTHFFNIVKGHKQAQHVVPGTIVAVRELPPPPKIEDKAEQKPIITESDVKEAIDQLQQTWEMIMPKPSLPKKSKLYRHLDSARIESIIAPKWRRSSEVDKILPSEIFRQIRGEEAYLPKGIYIEDRKNLQDLLQKIGQKGSLRRTLNGHPGLGGGELDLELLEKVRQINGIEALIRE